MQRWGDGSRKKGALVKGEAVGRGALCSARAWSYVIAAKPRQSTRRPSPGLIRVRFVLPNRNWQPFFSLASPPYRMPCSERYILKISAIICQFADADARRKGWPALAGMTMHAH
ncbi:hypothetical protein BD309DRAFT_314263 [Dichomitus squalens]|nr:hypothetical protein BD309DRAFT_314263 [Dichomitus squalens]